MYFSLQRTRDFTNSFISKLAAVPQEFFSNIDIFIIPDFISLTSTIAQLESSRVPIWTGAQDCHWEDQGAFTGEENFGEDDAMVAKKTAAVSRNGMIPLVCIGERTQGDVHAAVDECRVQVDAIMSSVADEAEVILAYEPVWAIGASQPAGEKHILDVVAGIRDLDSVKSRTGTTRVLYGGSAGPGLYEKLKTGLDGLFLGRFGHDPQQFIKTIQEIAEA
ncbi:hypothetical protein TrVFT333_010978 [Trichoderma virens FT-333]|nr:hypothetical protein TrVFT333_010978 [Trichoderma virens FT-333]